MKLYSRHQIKLLRLFILPISLIPIVASATCTDAGSTTLWEEWEDTPSGCVIEANVGVASTGEACTYIVPVWTPNPDGSLGVEYVERQGEIVKFYDKIGQQEMRTGTRTTFRYSSDPNCTCDSVDEPVSESRCPSLPFEFAFSNSDPGDCLPVTSI